MRLPEDVSAAMDRLERAGFAAYAVGGCVRDAELGLAQHDWDVCTAATPAEMQRVFAGERTIETGLRHGTLTVILDRTPLEITTFRHLPYLITRYSFSSGSDYLPAIWFI